MTQTLQSGPSPAAGCWIKVAPVVCRAGPVALAPCELQGVGGGPGQMQVFLRCPHGYPKFHCLRGSKLFPGTGELGPVQSSESLARMRGHLGVKMVGAWCLSFPIWKMHFGLPRYSEGPPPH